MTRTLGIDLGNAKVKYVLLEADGDKPRARWASYPLPYSEALLPDRGLDFEAGLMATAGAFLGESGLTVRHLDRVVLVTSHFYSYPSFSQALHHTARMAQALFGDRAFLVGADGALYDADQAIERAGCEVLRFAATKFWGSAYLASKLVKHGLSVDVGTTSTDVIAIRDGAIEPAAQADPDAYNLSRLETQRLMWYGMTATPLDYVARQASTDGRSYPLYPRMGATECLTRILELVPADLATRHAYFGRYPNRDAALSDLAQAFGLDRELLSEAELVDLAGNLHRQLIARVAEGIARVATQAGLGNPRGVEAAIMGLGKEALARPALLACGVPHDRIRDLEDVLGPELSAVSTAYGAALKGMESLSGAKLSLV